MVTGAEAHRLAKPYCMGSLYWQLNDCWPAISWSGIDHRGYWKAMQAYVRQAYEPVMFTLKSKGDTLELWGVNDTRKSRKDTVHLRWWLNGETELKSISIPVALNPGNAVLIDSFLQLGIGQNLKDTSRVIITLESSDKPLARFYLVVRPVHYQGVHAPLEWTCTPESDHFRITLYSKAIHTSVYLPPEILFDQRDNFLTILPDRPLTIKVKTCPDYMRSFPFNVIRRSGFGDP
jgi:beta-mannosidase